MILYHGTYEDSYIGIIKDGFISNNFEPNDTTQLINDSIEEVLGENLRDKAIYLTEDLESTFFYDYAFDININRLNTNLLFVADNYLADKILSKINEENYGAIKKAVNEYEKSFMSYEKYIKLKEKYKNPEYLYFGNINIKDLITEEDFNKVKEIQEMMTTLI